MPRMPDTTAKLTDHADRVRAVVECAACGSDVQVSGDTFDDAEQKLAAATGYTMADGYLTGCPACTGENRIRKADVGEDPDDE